MRSNGSGHDLRSDPTVQWMVDDVAARCRAVLDALAQESRSVARLGTAGMELRSAADDLVALVELIDGPAVASGDGPTARAFDVAFDLRTSTADRERTRGV